MRIQITESPELSYLFPYQPNFKDGRSSNGGFDLVDFPDDVDKVTEAQNFPELRRVIDILNVPTGYLRTLGCSKDFTPIPGGLRCDSYLAVAFRDPKLFARKDAIL